MKNAINFKDIYAFVFLLGPIELIVCSPIN